MFPDYQAGELSGRLALDHCRLDNWSHHALAHNFEESNRPLQGTLILANTEDDWKRVGLLLGKFDFTAISGFNF